MKVFVTLNGVTTECTINVIYFPRMAINWNTANNTSDVYPYGSLITVGYRKYCMQADFSQELYTSDGLPYISFDGIFFEDGAINWDAWCINNDIKILLRTSYNTKYSTYSSYALTFEDSNGRQGPPSTATGLMSRKKTQAVALTFNGIETTGDETPTWIHVFRADRGMDVEKYRHIAKVAYGTASYTDYIASSDALGYQLPCYRGTVPPTPLYGNRPEGMTKVIQTPTMFYVGYKNKTLYFSGLREQNHMFPEAYFIELDHDIIDIMVLGSGVMVVTAYEAYTIWGQQPYEHWLQKVCDMGCYNINGMEIIGDTLYYATQNGIIAIRGTQSNLITEPFFTPEQFRALSPSTMILDSAEEKLFVFGDTDNYMFSFDGGTKIVNITSEDTTFNSTEYTYKTKKFKFDQPVAFKIARIIADTYNSIIFYLYRNGTLVTTRTITDDKPIRLERLEEARYWEVKVVSKDTINEISIYQDESEMLIKQ